MKNQINIAIASFGMSGLVFHGPLLKADPRFRVLKVWERSKNLSPAMFPDVNVVRTFEEIILDSGVELVVVNTPDHTHVELTEQALEAGKHVVVEKPFTLNSCDGAKLIRLARKKGLLLSVFQNRRWDGDFLTVKEVLRKKWLGRLVEFEVHFDRYRNFIQEGTWKETPEYGTGIIYNLGSHIIDQVLHLFGLPGFVTACIGIQRTGGEVNDSFDLWLEYQGMKAILKSSYLVREPGPRFILHGTLGSFVKHGTDPQEELMKKGIIPGGEGWGREPEEYHGLLHTEMDGGVVRNRIPTLPGRYQAYYENIYSVLREGGTPAVKAEDALHTIRVIEAALESHRTGNKIALTGLPV